MDGPRSHLIHFVDTSLDFWSRISEELEERGDPWDNLFTLSYLLSTRRRKCVVHDGEFTSLFWLFPPASFERTPNWIRQPSVPTWVRWAGRPCTGFNVETGEVGAGHSITGGEKTREYLISTGRLYRRLSARVAIGRITNTPRKKSWQGSKHHSLLRGRLSDMARDVVECVPERRIGRFLP